MLWVSPPPAPLDFNLIHEGSVRAARCPVTKKFSVELDMHFVDGETVTNLLECKVSHQLWIICCDIMSLK